MCLLVAGCKVTTLPDPNDPLRPGPDRARVIWNALNEASVAANARVFKHEISDAQASKLMRDYALKLDQTVDINGISPQGAWMYGNLFMTARDWPRARQALQIAVKYAPNNDRFVNDSLLLAEADAQLGQVPKAIEIARATFGVPPEEKAPILPAVLLRIYPAAKNKGYNTALADLLIGAIQQHEQTVVNPSTDPGKIFLLAKPHHIYDAYKAAIELYQSAGRADLAQQTLQQAQTDPNASG